MRTRSVVRAPAALGAQPRGAATDVADEGDVMGGSAPPPAAVDPGPCLLTDAQLVVAVARGRADALAELYDRHGGTVYSLASQMCGPEAAEDVTHEVFLHLWREPELVELERGASLAADLVAHTLRRAADRTCSGAARLTSPAPDHHEVGERARRAFAGLPVAERDAITLAYFGGHTYGRVAELLGQPEAAVKRQVRRGLARLRAAGAGGRGELGHG